MTLAQMLRAWSFLLAAAAGAAPPALMPPLPISPHAVLPQASISNVAMAGVSAATDASKELLAPQLRGSPPVVQVQASGNGAEHALVEVVGSTPPSWAVDEVREAGHAQVGQQLFSQPSSASTSSMIEWASSFGVFMLAGMAAAIASVRWRNQRVRLENAKTSATEMTASSNLIWSGFDQTKFAVAATGGEELTGIDYVSGGIATAQRSVGTQSSRVICFAEAADTVTGTKFEEDDEEKNPQGRGGHQVKGMPEVDPETAKKQEIIREHQQSCARLSWAEEMRTILAQPKGFATISTVAQKGSIEGFPTGSIVAFSTDENGRPIFVFSTMSTHTKNLQKDTRASLCVTEPNFVGAADARVVLTGHVKRVPKGEDDELRKRYMESHPNAYWATFGDFAVYRMDDILDVAFVGGFARAGGVTPKEYLAAEVDPCAAFAAPVMSHMNDDHESATIGYVQYLIGTGKEIRGVKSAKMKSLDRFGFNVRVVQEGGEGVLRVPFPEPVVERKQIKVAIMNMSKKCAEIAQAEAPEAKPEA